RLLVLEIAIHRREPDVGDLVQVAEVLHQKFSYIYSRYLTVGRVADLALHAIDQLRQPYHAYRPLFAGFQQPSQNLLTVDFLASSSLFHYYVRAFVDALVAAEA